VDGALNVVRSAFAAKPGLLEVFSKVIFPALTEIGEEWHAKTLSIDQEHVATNAVKEALTLFHSEVYHKESNGLSALCACCEGDLHDIAIRCVGYYLETEGWHVTYLGQSLPSTSVVDAIRAHKPNLVALSATIVQNERTFLNTVNHKILPVARRVRAKLAIGGHNIKERFGARIKADHLCNSIVEIESIVRPDNYTPRKNGR
jgi:methanogenic corrinoid protein MtbC1